MRDTETQKDPTKRFDLTTYKGFTEGETLIGKINALGMLMDLQKVRVESE